MQLATSLTLLLNPGPAGLRVSAKLYGVYKEV